MTNNELSLEQFEHALDLERETSEWITKRIKESFEEEHRQRYPLKMVKYFGTFKYQKRSAA